MASASTSTSASASAAAAAAAPAVTVLTAPDNLQGVSASSTDTSGSCAPNLCGPSQVVVNQTASMISLVGNDAVSIDNSGILLDRQRWRSVPEVHDLAKEGNDVKCGPQWMGFRFKDESRFTNLTLFQMDITYAELSFTFQNPPTTCPTIYGSLSTDPDISKVPFATYIPKIDYACQTRTSNLTTSTGIIVNVRVDSIRFYENKFTKGVKEVRMQWMDLGLGGDKFGTVRTCQIDVAQVVVTARESSPEPDTSTSTPPSTSPPTPALLAIIVISSIVILLSLFVMTLYALRRYNIRRRMEAALKIRKRKALEGLLARSDSPLLGGNGGSGGVNGNGGGEESGVRWG